MAGCGVDAWIWEKDRPPTFPSPPSPARGEGPTLGGVDAAGAATAKVLLGLAPGTAISS